MQRIGRYDVVRPLGRGGMGQVFLGRDPSLERDVALKLLVRETDPNARVLMQDEAKALAALSHPNIVTIYEIGDDDGQQFIAMEYLPGKSLRDVLEHDSPTRDSLVAICAQVATAVEAAHAAGILHRDIKPENVVVGKTIKVVDFGIARRMDRQSMRAITQPSRARATEIVDAFTRTLAPIGGGDTLQTEAPVLTDATQTIFGTPAYMAPEVLLGEKSSNQSDVYSLGVMLYECLTGRRPFEGPTLYALIANVVGDTEVPPIEDPLAELVARMLDRDPAKRPSLQVVARALGRQRSMVDVNPPGRKLVVGVAIAAIAAAGIVFAWSRRADDTPPPVIDRGRVAFQPFVLDIPSYGAETPHVPTITRIAGNLIKDMGVPIVGPDVLFQAANQGSWERAAFEHDALFLVSATIVERDRTLSAQIAITDLAAFDRDHRVTWKRVSTPNLEVAELLDQLALVVAREIRPSSQPLPRNDPSRATDFLVEARKQLAQHELTSARANLDEAVHFDPTLLDAWTELATLVTRLQAPDPIIDSTYQHATRLTTDPMRARILRARGYTVTGNFKAALAELQPFEHADLAAPLKRDLLFQMGEAYWHDGHHERGYDYFKRTIEIDPTFVEPASHAGEYALARRKLDEARLYLGIQRMPIDWVDLAAGNYEKLVDHGSSPDFRYWAGIVLERKPLPPYPHPGDPFTPLMDRIADAAAAGDTATTREAVTDFLVRLEPQPYTGAANDKLVNMIEAVLAAGDGDATHRLLAVLGRHSAKYNFKRLSLLAWPLLGDPNIPDDQLTDRLRVLAAAMRAESEGKHAVVATLLHQLVDDPTWEWDYVERVALVRNLRALGRTKEAAAVCADTLKPINLRYVFLVARAYCRKST